MKIKSIFFVYLLAICALLTVSSCKKKPDDAALTQSIQTKLQGISGVMVAVKEGVVTLSGEVETESMIAEAAAAAQAVEGVKSVMNSLTVKPVPVVEAPAPVVINPDDSIRTVVEENFKKYNISGVTASVKEGVVTLTGNVTRKQLQEVMKAANETKPKQVKNELTITK